MTKEAKHPLIRLMMASLGVTALGIAIIGLAAPGAASDSHPTSIAGEAALSRQ